MFGVGGAGRERFRVPSDQQSLRACIYIYTLRRVCAVTRLRYKLTYAARPMCGKERKLACRRRCQFCGAPAVVAPSLTMRAQMNPTAPRFAFVYACIDMYTYARTRGALRDARLRGCARTCHAAVHSQSIAVKINLKRHSASRQRHNNAYHIW